MSQVKSTADIQGSASESEVEDPLIGGSSDAGQTSDTGSAGFGGLDFDTFAMTSLQSTASAILAAQQFQLQQPQKRDQEHYQLHSGVTSGSESETGRSRQISPPGVRRASSWGKGGQSDEKPHSERHMWSSGETQALVNGCNKHGIGNWKAILNDQQFTNSFVGRTPGDLKDRFRTYFPDAYHELYPNAKTHTSRAVRSKAPDGTSIFEKGKTKERRPFTQAEDEVLKRGYERFGSHWAIIAKEPVFEGKRKSTDLRDRFRNAFPNLYEQAGYKPRAKSLKKERRQSSSGASQNDRPALLTAELHGSFSSGQADRPALAPRSETSTSVHSQAVSEHSEGEESDYHDLHYKYPSDGSNPRFGEISLQSAASSLMSRSQSFDYPQAVQATVQQTQQPAGEPSAHTQPHSGTVSPVSGSCSTGLSVGNRLSLRRSHSSKRGSTKINTLEQAVKSASVKCNKEAILASHQQHHQQHIQQPHRQQQHKQARALAAAWPERFAWEPDGSSANVGDLADMDLDQMGEIIDAHSAAELLGADVGAEVTRADTQPGSEPETLSMDTAANASASNALLANLYQQLGLAGQDAATNRPVSVDSFQDLLDPLGPSQAAGSQWSNLTTSTLPWTPISSSAAPQQAFSSPATAQRRDHEHNQFAGDLLHRGNFDALDWNPETFVNMANMQLHVAATAQSRPAEQARNNPNLSPSDRTSNTFPIQRPTMPADHSLSMPSVHDLISKSSRRLSNPPRPAGINEEFGSDSIFQSAYRNPYPYPADDMSLVNSSLAGNVTLFPSLMGSGPASDGAGVGNLSRRRRSTDTLREGTFGMTGQSWRGPLEGFQVTQLEDTMDGSDVGQHAASQHSGDHSRSLSSIDQGDDDDAPSRAASVGNMNLVSGRDNVLYAESLPDLTTSAFGGEQSSSASEPTFANIQHLQMSYDDMDLPSFLNRSPSFAHTTAVSNATFSSPRMTFANDGNWLKMVPPRFNAARNDAQREGDAQRSSTLSGQNAGMSGGGQALSQGAVSSPHFSFSGPLNDAGALDRLEHLYLEGLHTPGSPNLFGHGQTAPPYSATNAQRHSNTNSGNLVDPLNRNGATGADAGSGYESV